MGKYWALLARYLKPQWRRVATLALLIAGGIALQLISPQIMRVFIDTVVAGASDTRPEVTRQLTVAALIYLGIAVVNQALSMATTYLSETVAWTATNALRRDLTLHSLRLDMSFHKVHTPGELIERIDGDVTTLASFFSQMVIRLVSNGLLAVGILIVLFYEDWRVGLVGVAYVSLIATAVLAVQGTAVAAWGDSRQASAVLFGFLGERLAATEDIRANGGEAHVMARLCRLMRTLFLAWRKARLVHALSGAVGSVAHLLTRVGALAIGALLFLSGKMTIGTVFLLIRYFGRLREPWTASDITWTTYNRRAPASNVWRPCSASDPDSARNRALRCRRVPCALPLMTSPFDTRTGRAPMDAKAYWMASRSCWNRGGSLGCWAAPEAARPPSRGSFSGYTIPQRVRSSWETWISATSA